MQDGSDFSMEPDDTFNVLMRRQGWHVIGKEPIQGGRKVIKWRTRFSKGSPADQLIFYEAFGSNTVRKLIRAILSRSQTRDDLARICSNETKLDETLTYLQAGGIVTQADGTWSRGPQCKKADNIGPTFEWYVAEWFRRELKAPTRHGVKVEEMPHGGDLDVVAFVGENRVWAECKTAKPDEISDVDLKLFLQRAFDFRPEIAVLLVDTESSVGRVARDVSNLWSRMAAISAGREGPPADAEEAKPIPDYTGLHWCARHVYVANVAHSVDRSLSNILRFHETYARRQIFVPTIRIWDFERGEVRPEYGGSQPDRKGPYSVNGMIWIEV